MTSADRSTSVPERAGSEQAPSIPAIRTESLTKVYAGADFAAVDRLDLNVLAGEIFGLLGPNGAGKTTTAGMLTTRVVPTSGRGFVKGWTLRRILRWPKQLSGIVSQQNTLDRQLTVWENLYFHGRLFGIGSKQSRLIADDLLERFQLAKWAKASVYALSGGMAQRLMVARAIFHRPAVLFLDEPTAGLDPQSRLALWEMLGELNRAGQTILLTTHYMEEADKLCDGVAIMDHGRILALGTPAELKQSVGADTVVTLRTSGDSAQLGDLLAREVDGVTRSRSIDGTIQLHMQRSEQLVPRIVMSAERRASTQSSFATILVPGVVGISVMFQGVQSIALAMAQEFGFTREIEDRVQAPCPIWLVAVAKVLSGAAQGVLSALIVLPIAAVVHAPGVHADLSLHWWIIVTFVPLSCIAMASLGLVLGTSFEPRNIGLMFGFIILPITFLGGTYYGWTRLPPVTVGGWHWLQTIVLINPLIYVNEGMRAAFTDAPHMHLYVIYPVVFGFAVTFLTIGLGNFRRRVLS